MATSFAVTLPYDDYLAANWLTVRRRWLWRGVLKFLLIVGFVYSVMMTIGSVVDGRWGWMVALADLITGFVLASVVLCVLALYWLWCVPRSARKIYEQYGMLDAPVRYTFDDHGFTSENEEGLNKLAWARLYKWAEDDRLLLMYRTQGVFYAVPKTQVDPALIDSLREALVAADVKQL